MLPEQGVGSHPHCGRDCARRRDAQDSTRARRLGCLILTADSGYAPAPVATAAGAASCVRRPAVATTTCWLTG